MSAQVVIVCDVCGDHGSVGSSPQDARAELKAWTRRQGLDLCPLCRLVSEAQQRLEGAAPLAE